MKRAAILLTAVFATVCVNAQYIDSEADVKIDAPSADADWNKTYNPGTAAEVSFAATGASASSDRNSCGNNSLGKMKALSFSSSDEHWIEVSVPSASNSTMAHLRMNPVLNSSTTSVYTEYVWTSTSSPFDATKAKRIEFTIKGYNQACSEVDLDLGDDVKSIRMYRRVKTTDNGDGTYSLACGDCKTNTGSGQTYSLFKFYVWLNKGPEIMTFKAFGQEGRISGDNIIVDVLYATDITAATVPDEITLSPGASFTGTNNASTAVNFSEIVPVVYSLTDGEGNTKSYNVLINRLPASTTRTLDKFAYVIDGDTRFATISGNTVTVTLPYSYGDGRKNATAKNSISTTIDFSDDLAAAKLGGGTSVADGVAMNIDYSQPQSVVITSEDGNSTTYTINVVYETPSAACDLLSFSLPLTGGRSAEGIIDNDYVNLYITSSDLASSNPFTPVYTSSPLSEVAPTIPIPMSFSSPYALQKTFRINAEEDGKYRDYNIIVNVDDVAPTVVSVEKPSDLTASSLAGPIHLTFSERVKLKDGSATAGKISIKKKSDNSVVWSGVLTISDGGLVGNAIFSGLEGLTDYVMVIESGSLTDYAGNELVYNLDFKTADGTLHTADLPYCSDMDGVSFEQRAFIASTGVYDANADTRGATTSRNGAYVLAAGQTLTLTAESVGIVDVVIFSYGQCNYNITAGSVSKDGAITIAYDNDGVEEQVTVNSSVVTPIVITNTGTNDIMIPYISVSAVGGSVVTDKDCNCK